MDYLVAGLLFYNLVKCGTFNKIKSTPTENLKVKIEQIFDIYSKSLYRYSRFEIDIIPPLTKDKHL